MGRQRTAVALMTAPRQTSYFSMTLESIRKAGFDCDLLVHDGPAVPFGGINLEVLPYRHGIKGAFKATLTRLLEQFPRVERYLVFQDDIRVQPGTAAWLDNQSFPLGTVASLYCAAAQDRGNGWRRVPLEPTESQPCPWHDSLGGCALLLDRSVAEKFLLNDPQLERGDRLGGALGELCWKFGFRFYVHAPSLVEHVGEITCRGRTAPLRNGSRYGEFRPTVGWRRDDGPDKPRGINDEQG